MSLFRTPESAHFSIEGLHSLINLKSFTDAMRLDGFNSVVQAMRVDDLGAVRDLAESKEMLSVLGSVAFREAAARDEMGMVVDAGLRDALARVPAE